ncbi:hypothetical protein LDENG_00242430 [Lucifuga dentata]|nr:hypothetical protein LDENG_00242430 [Lucifuga dentata]
MLPLLSIPSSSPTRSCWGRSTVRLACSQEDLDQHLKHTYSDPERELELGKCNILVEPPDPDVHFDMPELQLKEVREVVHKARASSAPEPSGTSYKVYKNYPKLLMHLWKILKVFWRRGKIGPRTAVEGC